MLRVTYSLLFWAVLASAFCPRRPMRMILLNIVFGSVSFWFVRCLRYMLAQRVCRRDPLPRRLDRICGRGPQLAWGQESAPLERRAADSGKESVRPKGGGVLSAAR